MRTRFNALSLAVVVSSGVLVAIAATSSAAEASSTFVPLTSRVADSRTNLGGAGTTPLGVGQIRTIVLAGRGGLPAATGIEAVLLDIDVVQPQANTHLTVYPSGSTRPEVASVVASAGVGTSNTVVTMLGANGAISIYGSGGPEHFIIDIQGYFSTATVAGAGGFRPIVGERYLDTRSGEGFGARTTPVAAGETITVRAGGVGDAPLTANAVFANLTAVGASSTGFLVAFPTGTARPGTSTLAYSNAGPTSSAGALRLGQGSLNIYNSGPSPVHLVLDGQGFFAAEVDDGGFTAATARLIDTRATTALSPGEQRQLRVAGRAGIPDSDLTVTILASFGAINPVSGGSLAVYPASTESPAAGLVSYTTNGTTRSNTSAVMLGLDGAVTLENRSSGAVHVTVDLQGYFLPPDNDTYDGAADEPISDTLPGDDAPVEDLPIASEGAFPDLSIFDETIFDEEGLPVTNVPAAAGTPSRTSANACRDKDGAYRDKGLTINHFNYCRVRAGYGVARTQRGTNAVVGRATFRLTAVGFGTNGGSGGQREFGFRVFVDQVNYDSGGANILLTVRVKCQTLYGSNCSPKTTIATKSMRAWDANPQATFTLGSIAEGGLAPDAIAGYRFRFEHKSDQASTSRNMNGSTARCDSAVYIRQTMAGEGCIFDNVLEQITYSVGDERVAAVARHIRLAQDSPDSTRPDEANKRIPGEPGSNEPLTRRYYDSTNINRSRSMARAVCQEVDVNYADKTQDCDEYPFARTYQNATRGAAFYSAKILSRPDNRSAGGRLGGFYTFNRMLDNRDRYYVRISG